ncbi:MAG: response regulator [Desulfuromonadales bacterium]
MKYFTAGTQDFESERESTDPASVEREPQLAANVRILLVEDEPAILLIFEKILSLRGWHVVPVENANEAIEEWERGDFDLIFMDLQMPHLNGLEATRIIRRLEREKGREHIPIVAVTAWCRPEDRTFCMEAGMDDYLPKPIHSNELYAMVRKHLTNIAS